jgi:hypothetical protein
MSKFAVLLALVVAFAFAGSAVAQTPAVPSAAKTFVLVPYDQPDGKDPHAEPVMSDLDRDFKGVNVSVVTAAPIDHLEAVAHAGALCAQYHADGLLVPEGRYEQTVKMVYAVLTNVTHYPAHVDFRLDEVGCDGVVHWSTTATADRNTSGWATANLNAVIDDAFGAAIDNATAAFARAAIVDYPAAAGAVQPAGSPAALDPAAKYAVVPFAQPGLADPRADDIMHSFMDKLATRKINASVTAPIDRLTVIADAASLCKSTGASGIIVPGLRVEQSSFDGRSYAELRLDVVGCDGQVLGKALGTADLKRVSIRNYGATVVAVSEQAMDPALAQLFHS